MDNRPWIKLQFVGLLAFYLVLTGCDDPSSVGLDLVESQTGNTEVVTLEPSLSDYSGIADLTGGTTASGPFRALFGKVEDPVAGNFAMTGYLDFSASTNVSSAFKASVVTFADLELNIDYVYGDTLTEIQLDIFKIDQDWVSAGVRADSFVVAQTLVTSASVTPSKGTIRIPLPANWVSANSTALRSETFTSDVHGFAFRATQGGAVLGVHFSGTSLRASSVPGDTVNFSLSKVLSTSTFGSATDNPDFFTLRDGAAETLSLRFPIENQDLGQAAIHRVIFRLNADDVNAIYPTGFSRPGITRIGLRAVAVDNKTRLDMGLADRAEDGSYSFDSVTLANVVQSYNLGNSSLDRFEIYFPDESSTVDVIAIKKGLPATFGPRAVITYTSIH